MAPLIDKFEMFGSDYTTQCLAYSLIVDCLQAIVNSPYKRLTLNEIYTWFSQHFSFFRYNTSQVKHHLTEQPVVYLFF